MTASQIICLLPLELFALCSSVYHMTRKRKTLEEINSEMSERGGAQSGLKPPSKIRPPPNRASGGGGDTGDSFKIGDRVKAAGKRGVIAFLGETQFASGQWAGIVLDDPVG